MEIPTLFSRGPNPIWGLASALHPLPTPAARSSLLWPDLEALEPVGAEFQSSILETLEFCSSVCVCVLKLPEFMESAAGQAQG